MQAASVERLERARAEAQRHPTRVLANALVNVAWRNGPVEDIHAGLARGDPLVQRRVTERPWAAGAVLRPGLDAPDHPPGMDPH